MIQSMRDFLRLVGYMALASLICLTATALAGTTAMTGLWGLSKIMG